MSQGLSKCLQLPRPETESRWDPRIFEEVGSRLGVRELHWKRQAHHSGMRWSVKRIRTWKSAERWQERALPVVVQEARLEEHCSSCVSGSRYTDFVDVQEARLVWLFQVHKHHQRLSAYTSVNRCPLRSTGIPTSRPALRQPHTLRTAGRTPSLSRSQSGIDI